MRDRTNSQPGRSRGTTVAGSPLVGSTVVGSALALGLAALSVVGGATSASAHGNASPKILKSFSVLSASQETATLGNRFFFAAEAETGGLEPYVSDGTPVGTKMLRDLAPGAGDSSPTEFTRVG